MQPVAGGWAVFASKGGADEHPAWYHNLLANPEVSVEVGSDTVAVRGHRPLEWRERVRHASRQTRCS